MIFEYMKENSITNFGYLIMFEDKPNLSILLENHELFNDIIIDSDDDIYASIDNYDMLLVGVTITDEDNNIFNAEDLTDDNVSELIYNIIPFYLYKIKTQGLLMEDFVDLDLMNMLFYDVLDEYIKERIS